MTIDSPRRMDGYVRVSRRMGREGPGYISPDIQRQAIQRWADYRGVEIAAWHFDEDESGGTQNRPGIREAMRRVVEGETDGIAAWRLNRFARNVAEALKDVETVHAAGGSLAFVEEDVDPTGPFGHFILTILLAVAALELNNIKAGWRVAKERAMTRGAPMGVTPFGYQRRPDGTLEEDPVDGPVLRETFTRAAREGIDSAHSYIAAHASRGTWNRSTVRRLLTRRSYLGEIRSGDLKAEVPQLVPRAVWEAAQPDPAKRRRPNASFPLSGLATCATCGQPLVGTRGGSDSRRLYRCSGSINTSTRPCPSPTTVSAHLLEGYVRAILAKALEDHPGYRGGEDHSGAIDAADLALQIAELELDDFLADTNGAAALRRVGRYDSALSARVEAVEEARAHYREAAKKAQGQAREVPAADVVRDAGLGELGVVLRGALASVVVARGRGPLPSRVRVVTKGAPPDVAVPGPQDPENGRVEPV